MREKARRAAAQARVKQFDIEVSFYDVERP
jgi:hypothetical protein